MKGRVLIIAGSDSGGGAGIQADIKTVTMLGGYAMTAVTAITVQNTLGVQSVHAVPSGIVAAQIKAVLSDIGADAIKIGMLGKASVIGAVADALAPYPDIPLVLDPVMFAKGGAALLELAALKALKRKLIPRARLLTPNIPEAEMLVGGKIQDAQSAAKAGRKLLELGPGAVLLKGGHMEGAVVTDMLFETADTEVFKLSSPRIDSRHTHGTGCTLASAIATGLAQGMTLPAAFARGRDYVRQAILTAPGLGQGNGPINHGVAK